MSNETYTFKEILFGLKNEYQNVTTKLNSIKKYLLLKENKIQNINLFLSQKNIDPEIQIVCILETKKNMIEKLLFKIVEPLDIFPNQNIDRIKIENINFDFAYNQELLDHTKQYEFNQIVKDILNDPFIQNIEPIHSGIGYLGCPFISVLANSIYLYESELIAIDYTPNKGNFLYIESKDGKKLTKERIEDSFYMEFPKSKFPKYYQDIIDNSKAIEKDIDIIGKINSKKVNLDIIEEHKKLILIKK